MRHYGPALNGDLVKGISIPVPPQDEIRELCDAVERQLSVTAKFEIDLEAQQLLIQAQHQAVLRDAFSGHLVPQNPTDEPASVLLSRIAAERNAPPLAPPSRREESKSVESD